MKSHKGCLPSGTIGNSSSLLELTRFYNVMGFVKQHGLEFKSLVIQSAQSRAKKFGTHNLWTMVSKGQKMIVPYQFQDSSLLLWGALFLSFVFNVMGFIK